MAKKKSKKYLEAAKQVEEGKLYNASEAFVKIKQLLYLLKVQKHKKLRMQVQTLLVTTTQLLVSKTVGWTLMLLLQHQI